jgi:DNA polymerase-3 subunit delta'
MAKRTKTIKLDTDKALETLRPEGEPPADLGAIIGQDRAVGLLEDALTSGRVHHAWLFVGPSGVGKRTAAEALAATLLDPTTAPDLSGALRPDPGGEVAQLIASRSHPDLHYIAKELAAYSRDDAVRRSKQRSIPVSVIREFLIEPAAASSGMRGGMARKVFIVDEADLMRGSGAEAQNAMLKTLEEPPAGTVILLTTSREFALLPTIRSRCQRIAFSPLDDEAMAQWMRANGVEAKGREAAWVMEYAAGSPGRAQLALRTGLYAWSEQLEPMLRSADQGRFPVELGASMAKLIDTWAADWVKGRASASKEAANHQAIGLMSALLAERYRGVLREAKTNDQVERASACIDAITQAERTVTANVNAKLVLEELAVRLSGGG